MGDEKANTQGIIIKGAQNYIGLHIVDVSQELAAGEEILND